MNTLIHHLRYGRVATLWAATVPILIRFLGPKFAAFLSYLGMNWGPRRTGPTILCLSRESFIKDVAELRSRGQFNYPMVMGGFTRFQMAWFPEEMQIQTFYQAYRGAGREDAVRKSTVYAHQLIRLASRTKEVDAVLSANFDYWQDVGFKQACRDLNIPFVVLSREHPIVPKVCDVVVDWYQRAAYRFDGAFIAVAGKSTRDVLARVGSVCRPEQVVITGLPRFDAWLDVDKNLPLEDRPWITLLTFTDGYYADKTFREVLEGFCLAARKHAGSSIRFLIKTKDVNDTFAIRRFISEEYAVHVVCTHDVDLFKVLPESRLVINYNSLSLVEAAMARTPIVIPAWGECKDRGGEAMYSVDNPCVANLVVFAGSQDAMIQHIAESVSGKTALLDKDAARAFVDEYIHIPSLGSCSENFEDFLQNYL